MKILVLESKSHRFDQLAQLCARSPYELEIITDTTVRVQKYDAIILDSFSEESLNIIKSGRPVLIYCDEPEKVARYSNYTVIGESSAISVVLNWLKAIYKPEISGLIELDRSGTVSFGTTSLNWETRVLSGPKGEVGVTRREGMVFELLVKHEGELVSSQMLYDEVWGENSGRRMRTAWAAISTLRTKLSQIGASIKIITNRDKGYLMENTDNT